MPRLWGKQAKRGTSSRFRGVSLYRRTGRWCAQVPIPGRDLKAAPRRNGYRIRHLGYFHDEVEAARAYNEAARQLWGEQAILNDLP